MELLLTDDAVTAELASLPGWTQADSSITATVTLADFSLAEAANHHPDILIQWNRVTLTLSTHSAGGLTSADFALARQIGQLTL